MTPIAIWPVKWRHRSRQGVLKVLHLSFLVLTVALMCLLQPVNAQEPSILSQGRVISEPNTVGAQSATLVIASLFMPVGVPSGGKIVVTVPDQARLTEGSNIPCQLKGVFDINTLCVTDGPQRISFVLPPGRQIFFRDFPDIYFQGVFYAPYSTAPTDSFKIQVFSPAGKLLAQDNGQIKLDNLQAAEIQSATIEQMNTGIVARPTAVYFTITTLNPIPPTGGVQLRIPKWNPLAPIDSRESYLIDQLSNDPDIAFSGQGAEDNTIDLSKLCSSKLGPDKGMSCSVYSTKNYDYITIVDMFTESREAGDAFSFYVSRMRNAISQSPVPFQILTFESVDELTPEGQYFFTGSVDKGFAQFEAQDPEAMDPGLCQVEAEDQRVQEFSTYKISFKVPVPVEEGCIVTIKLPEDFELSAGDLERVEGWGIFGSRTALTFGVDESANVIKIVGQCVRYSVANFQSQIEITKIQGPKVVRRTKSFLIQIQDKNSKGISIVDRDIFYNPTPGTIQGIQLKSTGSTVIEASVNMNLSFMPDHAVEGTSYLEVTLPDQIEFSCMLSEVVGIKSQQECKVMGGNVLRFDNPFIDDSYPGDQPIAIMFRNRVLPGANLMIRGIKIETYMIIESQDFLIDTFEDFNLDFFAPNSQLFLNSEVLTGNEEVYTMTDFVFIHKLANNVPSDAIMHLNIPKQIEVSDVAVVEKSCSAFGNLMTTLSCKLITESDGTHKLTITNAFPILGLDREDEFKLQITDGLYTPLSMKTSDTFQMVITDKDGHEINYVRLALTLTMKQGKDVGPLQVEVGSGLVGHETWNEVTFLTPAPLYTDFLIIVNIPEEARAPMPQDFECLSFYPLSEDNFKCRINGQRVTVTVALDEAYLALISPSDRIPIGELIKFKFTDIRNPPSTYPTENYEIQIKTNDYQIVAVQRTGGAPIINKMPAAIQSFDFSAFDLRQLVTTTVTIEWTNTQVYPEGLSVLIYYDPEQIRPDIPDNENTVPCIFRNTVAKTCQYLRDQPGVIQVTDLLQAEQNPGLLLSLTLTKQLINISTPKTTSSWSMTTFTDSSTKYSIDRIEGGMTFTFACNLPCKTCVPGQPDVCTECNIREEYLILYEGKCYTDCPERSYQDAYKCYPCDEKCKTCAINSGSTCTSCYGGFADFPFQFGNTCVDQCVFGFYGNRDSAQCSSCDVEKCESCSETPTNCLTCKLPPAGEPITKFFHENQCKDECPPGWLADVDNRSNVCLRCNENCANCFGNKDQCQTCKPGFKLNTIDLTCVRKCPEDITVELFDADRGQICEQCDSSCVACKDKPTFCTACQDNLSLEKQTGLCRLECDYENFTQVSLGGECVGCSASCKTCQLTQDNCLSCIAGKYFYGNSCFDTCPNKDGYQYEPNLEGVCTIPGIICPFGYELTPTGNGCALMAQICIFPNTLNYDKTTCVPGSENWIPFPMLAFCVAVILPIALISKCAAKESGFIANLIVFGSIVEALGMFVIIYFAYDFGISPVVYMMLIAVMFQIAINLFFCIVFQKQIMNDITFRHWVGYNKCNVHTISFFGLIFNFKMYRLLQSKFCGGKRFDAPFADDYKFYTPLNLASFINLFLVQLLSMVACIFGIYYVAFGYQLFIECLEFLIIEVIMIILCIVEYCQKRNNLMKKKPQWKVQKNKVDRMKVNAGVADDFYDENDQDPDATALYGKKEFKERKEVKAKSLKVIDTMQKLLASKLVKRNALGEGPKNTKEEIERLHEKELMLRNRRRCMSFRIERPNFREAWGIHSDDDVDCDQNFISEPGSPRSKEMLHNPYFANRVSTLNKVYQMRDQFDNCYAEAKDPSVWPLSDAPQANKKLQTNVMELLGVDDLVEDTQTQITESGDGDQVEDVEYDPQQTAHLINRVIARLDSDPDDNQYSTNDHLMVRRRGSDPNADNYSTSELPPKSPLEGSKLTSSKAKRKRKRLTRRRMAELPNFDVEEILGEFEVEANGNEIILQTANGKLNDKYGRLVNRRGYLIDLEGNVVTRGNVFIFYKEEVDFDDEVPAPYCFQKGKNVKYMVKNFSAHRRMKKKDKLAMQDEFIEREYLRLKQAARQKGGVYSQQHSHKDDLGFNQSEKVHRADSSSIQNQPMSSHLKFMDNSGAQLLAGDISAQQLGDVNLSNIIMQNRQDQGIFDDGEGLNAEAFIAQNTTQVKRKPPSSRHSTQQKRQSRRSSRQLEGNEIDEDDEFINQVTEPMKAKTKFELLGSTAGAPDKSFRSRQSSRSRSRSKSNDKQSVHSSKRGWKIKGGKMLNEESHKSLEKEAGYGKGGAAAQSDQHQSQAEMMAMPTAGEAEIGENDLRDLDFDQRQLLNNSSSMNLNNKKQSKRSVLTGQNSRPDSLNKHVYENENLQYKQRKQALVNDEEFIKKVQQFNSYLDKKKLSYNEQQKLGVAKGRNETSKAAVVASHMIDDTFLNPDGSVRQIGLAHKNLNNVYGKVRAKFNKQVRQGGADLKFRPQGSSFRNRVDEPRRIIAGMTYGQRERMLQLEINNLIENKDDGISMNSIQRKLQYGDTIKSVPNFTPNNQRVGSSNNNQRRSHVQDEKLNQLRSIYSEHRLGASANQKFRGESPRSHANHLTFEASQIIQGDFQESQQIDQEILKVSQRVSDVQALDARKSSVRTMAENNGVRSSTRAQQKTNRTAQNNSGNHRTTPTNIMRGKYL